MRGMTSFRLTHWSRLPRVKLGSRFLLRWLKLDAAAFPYRDGPFDGACVSAHQHDHAGIREVQARGFIGRRY
jgi:hypothetical protein